MDTNRLPGTDVKLAQCFLAVDDHEALDHHTGGTGAPHADAVPRVPDRTITPTRTAQGGASPEADHHTIELIRPPPTHSSASSYQSPAADPDISLADREAVATLLAKGVLRGVDFTTAGCDALYARVEASGADVLQEPMDQPYGVRDCAFRDPAGTMLRFMERRD